MTVGDHPATLGMHERFPPLWNAMVGDDLPARTEYAQTLQGRSAGLPRAPMPAPTGAQKASIRDALAPLDVPMASAGARAAGG